MLTIVKVADSIGGHYSSLQLILLPARHVFSRLAHLRENETRGAF